MSAIQQVGFIEKLIRSICKVRMMRMNDFNLASILYSYRADMKKSFEVDYYGSRYKGILDNRADWLVYFLGHTDACRIHFVSKVGEILKHKAAETFTCYDVGAGRGDFSLALASIFDHVVAFEKSGTRFSHLSNNIAVSEADNIVNFNIELTDEDELPDRLHKTKMKLGKSAKDETRISPDLPSVEEKRGDTAVAEIGLPSPDFIRINAGNDYRSVLRGFESRLESSQPVILIEQSMSGGHRFADETDLRSVLYEDAMLFSLAGSPYQTEYRLTPFDPEAPWIVCYPPKVRRIIQQEIRELAGLR